MVNTISSISPTGADTSTHTTNSSSSTADILSSFKKIMSVMTATNSLSSSAQPAGTGMNMNDLMAPLMLLMLERLLELNLNQENSATGSEQSSAANTVQAAAGQTSSTVSGTVSSSTAAGSKPEPSGWPVQGRITQEPHTGHMAFDIAVPVGTHIKTTMDGKVVHAGWNDQGYGNLVIVENGSYRTYYAHLSSIPVSVGDQVKAGTVIGLSGNTGHSTGPHLHYEIRQDRIAIDPTALTKA